MKAALSAAGVLAGGGGGAVTALTLADAPWGVITAVVLIAIVCSMIVYLVQAVLPQDSPDRLNFWLEFWRHRAAQQARSQAVTAGSRLAISPDSAPATVRSTRSGSIPTAVRTSGGVK